MLFGQCSKDHIIRKITFYKFYIPRGHTNNPILYEQMFLGENNKLTCPLETEESKFIPLCQPCYV
jgi:hypothetical protein